MNYSSYNQNSKIFFSLANPPVGDFLSTDGKIDATLTVDKLFDYYRNVYVPAYADLVGYYGGKPEQVLIEVENTLAHLSQYFNPNFDSKTQEHNLHKAYSHLVRVTLDCYKLLWWKVNEELLIVYNDIDTNIFYINVSKEKFTIEYRLFVIKSQFARKRELECIGIDQLESVELYKDAISIGENLLMYIDDDKKRNFSRFKQLIKTREFIISITATFILGIVTGIIANVFYNMITTK